MFSFIDIEDLDLLNDVLFSQLAALADALDDVCDRQRLIDDKGKVAGNRRVLGDRCELHFFRMAVKQHLHVELTDHGILHIIALGHIRMDAAKDAEQRLADVDLCALIWVEMTSIHRVFLEHDTALAVAQRRQHRFHQAFDRIEIRRCLHFLPAALLQAAAQHERQTFLHDFFRIYAADLKQRHILDGTRQVVRRALQQAWQDAGADDLALLAHR